MKKCLVIGAAMLDLTMHLDRLPLSGEDVYGNSQEMSVGGCACNAADILKHYKVPYDLFAPVGTGMYADIIRKALESSGHTSMIHSDSRDNGYCLCLIEPDGERTFITLPGIECSFRKEWFETLNPSDYSSAYVSGYEIEGEGGDHIIEFFEDHPDLLVYYAPGPRITFISEEKQKRMEAIHPVLHLNEKEALEYTGTSDHREAADLLYRQFQNTVIITLGSRGVYLKNEETLFVPSSPVKAIDTTGAGDSHIGTIIALRQLGHDFKSALSEANRISSMVVQVKGPVLSEEEFQKGTHYHE